MFCHTFCIRSFEPKKGALDLLLRGRMWCALCVLYGSENDPAPGHGRCHADWLQNVVFKESPSTPLVARRCKLTPDEKLNLDREANFRDLLICVQHHFIQKPKTSSMRPAKQNPRPNSYGICNLSAQSALQKTLCPKPQTTNLESQHNLSQTPPCP